MTIQYDFDTRPMVPGEMREFTLTSSEPATVRIKCFITSPPPPGYRPCAECGTYSIQQGQTIQIEASQLLFSMAQGGLDITISDLEGEVIMINLQVEKKKDEPDGAPVVAAVSM
jgi:hypothetical protein